MKIITITYPRYLDNVRLGPRYYHFACADGVEQGDTAIIRTEAGRVCTTVEAVDKWRNTPQELPIARILPDPQDLFEWSMADMQQEGSTP